MASFNKRVKHVIHREYELDSPVHLGEFGKALAVARQEACRDLGFAGDSLPDDILRVEARDDKVLITWWSESQGNA